MSFFQNIVKNVREFYSEINAATLTGAIDVVVVEQEDGTLKSSPFHVRFGKLGVLKAKEKIVDIEINGEPVEIQMKLDDTGAAFFVEPLEDGEEDEMSESLATSPIPDQADLGWQYNSESKSEKYVSNGVQTEVVGTLKLKSLKKKRRKKKNHSRKSSKTSLKEILNNDLFAMDDINDANHEDETGDQEKEHSVKPLKHDVQSDLNSSSGRKLRRANSTICPGNMDQIRNLARQLKRANSTNSQGIIESGLIGSRVPKSSSEAEALVLEALLTESQEDKISAQSVVSDNQYFSDSEIVPKSSSITNEPDSSILSESEVDNLKREDQQNIWRWGELPNSTNISPSKSKPMHQKSENDVEKEKARKISWFGSWGKKSNNIADEQTGAYLDDIINDPDKLFHYIGTNDAGKSEEIENIDPLDLSDVTIFNEPEEDVNDSNSLPKSPESSSDAQYDSDYDQDLLSPILSKHLPDFAASLCGGLNNREITLEKFEEHTLTYEEFIDQLKKQKIILNDPNLVIRVHDKYLTWTAAAPILLSVLLFKQPLAEAVIEQITKDGLDVNINMTAEEVKKQREKGKKSWFGWLSGSSEEGSKGNSEETERIEMACQAEPDVIMPNQKIENEQGSSSSEMETEEVMKPKRFRKTLRLSKSKLSEINIQPGSNEVEFSVTTAFQGTTRCKCHIYLWHNTDKVVISDIDGTITKSDVLGHILPVIGNDWAQSGVAQLFSKIRENGYQIMYLSARAIGQASITKDYLQSVRQGDVCLPDGPLFLNPDSLYYAFRREVIDRNPEEFKIQCLKDIQSLFNEKNPFFAGYGNRPNDAFSYRAVGIPVSKIFTINPAGELKYELTETFQTSYTEQDAIVDQIFPSVGTPFNPQCRNQEYSNFCFWREPLAELGNIELED